MKCISKFTVLILACSIPALVLSGCGSERADLENAYDIYDTSALYGLTEGETDTEVKAFAQDLCIAGYENSDGKDLYSIPRWLREQVYLMLPQRLPDTRKMFTKNCIRQVLLKYLPLTSL